MIILSLFYFSICFLMFGHSFLLPTQIVRHHFIQKHLIENVRKGETEDTFQCHLRLWQEVTKGHLSMSFVLVVPETLKQSLESPPAIVQQCPLWRSLQPGKTHDEPQRMV